MKTTRSGWTWTIVLLAATLATSASRAAEYFVDQKHAQAADTNSGTAEHPWKTIRHAAGAAQAGDTIRVKAGRYHEGGIHFAHGGERVHRLAYDQRLDYPLGFLITRPVAIGAHGDEPVIVDGSVAVPPENWTRVEGSQRVFALDLKFLKKAGSGAAVGAADIGWVFRDGQPLAPHVTSGGDTRRGSATRFQPNLGIPGDTNEWCWAADAASGKLYVNFGGGTPAAAGVLEVSIYPYGFHGDCLDYLELHGLTLVRYGRHRAIDFSRVTGAVISDCFLQYVGEGINSGDSALVQRNTVLDAMGIGLNPGSRSLVQDNLVIRNFRDPFQTRNGYLATAITYFGKEFIRFRNNVVLESPGNGFWPDCYSAGHMHYGNSVYDCKGNGFYIESPAFHNLLMYNVCARNRDGIWLRSNAHNLISRNYVRDSNSGILLGGTEEAGIFMENTLITHNYLRDVRVGIQAGLAPGRQPQTYNRTDGNRFDPSVKHVAYWGGQGYLTVADFRAATGNESAGLHGPLPEAEIGLISFRVAEAARSWEAIEMIGNPRMDRWDLAGYDLPYFWHPGTPDGDETRRWRSSHQVPERPGPVLYDPVLAPQDRGGYVLFTSRPPYVIAPDQAASDRMVARQRARGDTAVLEVFSVTGRVVSATGVGFHSPSLPTTGGAVVDVRLHVELRDVAPAAPGGGLLCFVEWSDYTRARVARMFVVGRDDAGVDHRPDHMAGTYEFRPIESAVTAPDWARRFRLFLGLRSCAGYAAFDDADIVRTRPAPAPATPPTRETPEAQPAPLLDPVKLNFMEVDLAPFLNRPLRDEVPDDGQGGWTDQGAGADMRGLETGAKRYRGVPFTIREPRSAVVLASKFRPQSRLPERVTIPVGNRSVDVLYFLQSGAWIGDDEAEHFHYLVRYADGQTARIGVIGGLNICDWARGPLARFTRNIEGQRPSIAETVGGGLLFPQVNVYLLEWLNPRPTVGIREIDFVSANEGVPILLGITMGQRK